MFLDDIHTKYLLLVSLCNIHYIKHLATLAKLDVSLSRTGVQ